jgi:hypothetical protein
VERRRAGRVQVIQLAKEALQPAGLMTSIMRAGVLPAFQFACSSPRGPVM